MSTHEQPTNPEPNTQPGVDQVVASPGIRVTGWTWVRAVAFACVAGLLSGIVLEKVLDAYKNSFEVKTGPYPTAEDMARIARARIESGTIAFAVTGALFGFLLGAEGGITRKSGKWVVVAGALGFLLGGLVEAGDARLGLWLIYTKFDPQTEDMLQSLLGHEALWVPIGLTGGLVFGLGLGGRGRWWRGAIGGLAGAALATVIYEFLGALVFATHGTEQPLANTQEMRFLAQILIPIGAAIGAVLAVTDQKKKPKPPQVQA
jgi:hypothetical protein